jgi:hypothetical protein
MDNIRAPQWGDRISVVLLSVAEVVHLRRQPGHLRQIPATLACGIPCATVRDGYVWFRNSMLNTLRVLSVCIAERAPCPAHFYVGRLDIHTVA